MNETSGPSFIWRSWATHRYFILSSPGCRGNQLILQLVNWQCNAIVIKESQWSDGLVCWLWSCVELIENFLCLWVKVLVILLEGEFILSSVSPISESVLLKERNMVHSLSVPNIVSYNGKTLAENMDIQPYFQ